MKDTDFTIYFTSLNPAVRSPSGILGGKSEAIVGRRGTNIALSTHVNMTLALAR